MKPCIDTKYEQEKNGGSLDFNFISLPSPAVDKNWGLPTYRLLHSLPLENYAVYNWNLLWMAFSPFCVLTFKSRVQLSVKLVHHKF